MTSIQGLPRFSGNAQPLNTASAITKNSNAFGDMLNNMVSDTNQAQANSDNAIQDLQAGNAQYLHEVMISAEEAEISLKMLIQMRNKALTAYEEIMRMQI
ncbi:MAG: flagellar hook-basal body complex protein FliE [Desulfotalea sp.]|nr:MAG: flagellar hook-basal body complex protein FliE [Desulfotalea sp.]